MPFINLYVVEMNKLGLLKPTQSEPTKVKHAQTHIIFGQREAVIGNSTSQIANAKKCACRNSKPGSVFIVLFFISN